MIAAQLIFAQNDGSLKPNGKKFYLYYGIAGRGSNLGKLMPTLRIKNRRFKYTKEQNSYFHKQSKRKRLIASGVFHQYSIDSIISLISELKDTTILRTNPCLMSGVSTTLSIVSGTDTTGFTLHNTSDHIVVKIVDIINGYLPENNRLPNSLQSIKNEDDCWRLLKERGRQEIIDSVKTK